MPRNGAALLLEANVGKPLLDVLRELMLDPDEQAAFADDPSRYLAQYGYEDVEADHLNEAFSLVADTLPPDVAQAVAATNPVAVATAADPADATDAGGPVDTGDDIDPDAFGGVDAGFDTMALNGTAADDLDDDIDGDLDGDAGTAPGGDGLDADGAADAVDTTDDGADPDGLDDGSGFGTGELDVTDLADDGGLDGGLDGGDAVAFGVGSEGAAGAATPAELDDTDDGAGLLPDDAPSLALDDVDGADQVEDLADDDGGVTDGGFVDGADYDDGEGGLGIHDGADDGSPLDPAMDPVDDGPADDPSFDDIGSF